MTITCKVKPHNIAKINNHNSGNENHNIYSGVRGKGRGNVNIRRVTSLISGV